MYYALGNTEINKYSMQKSNINKYKLILLITNSIFIRVETTRVEHIFGTDPLRSNTYSERTHPHSTALACVFPDWENKIMHAFIRM